MKIQYKGDQKSRCNAEHINSIRSSDKQILCSLWFCQNTTRASRLSYRINKVPGIQMYSIYIAHYFVTGFSGWIDYLHTGQQDPMYKMRQDSLEGEGNKKYLG